MVEPLISEEKKRRRNKLFLEVKPLWMTRWMNLADSYYKGVELRREAKIGDNNLEVITAWVFMGAIVVDDLRHGAHIQRMNSNLSQWQTDLFFRR